MTSYVGAILFAVVLWWSTTALAIHLNGLPRRTFVWTLAGATLVMAASLLVMIAWADATSVTGAYVAFTAGLLYWAWQDVSFYLGSVTGWRKERCPDGCAGWRHFLHAIEASIHHELAILAAAAVLFLAMWGAPNEIGLWTFCILWWMHQSAKLNVFLGVTNLNTDFLPEHLRFLEGYFRKRPMNLLFPVSITVSTVAACWLAWLAAEAPAGSFAAIGYTLLATLMTLALLEHWFLVLPLPFEKLWRWAIVPSSEVAPCRIDVVVGKLGSGKTTVLRSMLDKLQGERAVVIANDFADLGVDASLLADRGADVVELPNGCICCTLRNDLAGELRAILTRWRPTRVLIEPSGVADVSALLEVLFRPSLLPAGSSVNVHGIFDASCFTGDYAVAPKRLEAQARMSDRIVVTKADLVDDATLALAMETLQATNPSVPVCPAVRGELLQTPVHPLQKAPTRTTPAVVGQQRMSTHEHGHHDHPHALQSWSVPLSSTCCVDGLTALLSSVVSGDYGSVERLKGIAETSSGWVACDIAAGRPSIRAFAPATRERARVMAIGTNVDTSSLASAFMACRADTATRGLPA